MTAPAKPSRPPINLLFSFWFLLLIGWLLFSATWPTYGYLSEPVTKIKLLVEVCLLLLPLPFCAKRIKQLLKTLRERFGSNRKRKSLTPLVIVLFGMLPAAFITLAIALTPALLADLVLPAATYTGSCTIERQTSAARRYVTHYYELQEGDNSYLITYSDYQRLSKSDSAYKQPCDSEVKLKHTPFTNRVLSLEVLAE